MAERNWFRGGKRTERKTSVRVLTAAATRLDLGSRVEAKRQRAFRQGWQLDAWAYRDSVPEFRYGVNFLANCASRIRVYPAAYGETGEADVPVPLADAGAPPQVVAACDQAMKDLGNGRLAMAGLQHSLSTNISVSGECFLLGQESPQTGRQTWTIRSVDEVGVYDEEWKLREIPNDPQGVFGWQTLDPDLTIVSRMWVPHPRFRAMADAPSKAIMDELEALLILRRDIRATGRSRLAGAGMLLIPNEIDIEVKNDDNDDPESDPFMGMLTRAMVTPISDEGSASAVVPIVIRGPGEVLAQVRLLTFGTQFDALAKETRDEIVGVIATGLDIPKEVIIGIADLNHWSAWQVDDNTFRHHVEPHVVTLVDCLTSGFLRPYLLNCDLPPAIADEWCERVLLWYDPTELVTHPDQTADAMNLHDRGVISNAALLRVAGFSEGDAPTPDEFLAWMISRQRAWPPNISAAVLHGLDPSLAVPPITVSGTVPGIKPAIGGDSGGVDVGEPPASPPATPVGPENPGEPVPPPASPPSPPAPPSVTASSKPKPNLRLSRKLAMIDRDLRARLVTAANAAMLRQLEKAGTRLASKVGRNETQRTKIATTRRELVAHALGEDAVTAAGFSAAELMHSDWSTFKDQFYEWTAAAQRQSLEAACQLAGIATDDESAVLSSRILAKSIDLGWDLLSRAMTSLATHALYNPDLNVDAGTTLAALNPDTMVPTGVIRAAVAIAGGAREQDFGIIKVASGAEVPVIPLGAPVGQIGTGSTISNLITSTGGSTADSGYEWIHGPSDKPFEPHLDLDGVEFQSFDDPVLANNEGFPDNAYFLPGDHSGCMCDFMPLWSSQASGNADDSGDSEESSPEG